jgi:hypothetical protein
MRRLGALSVLLWAASAAAHVIDVYPVRVDLRADPGVLRVTLESNVQTWGYDSSAWAEGMPMAEFRRRSEDYLRGHFTVSVDGRALEPRVTGVRVYRPLWQGESMDEVVIRLRYDFPETGETVVLASSLFRDDWEEVEGKGAFAPRGVMRDFRTIVRWSPWPGGGAVLDVKSPERRIPRSAFVRSRARRWGESGGVAARAFAANGGGAALLLSLLLFVPGRGPAWAGVALALLGIAVEPFLPWTPAAAERLLGASLVAAGLVSMSRRGEVPWLAAILLGAPAAASAWARTGASYREATAFSGFSWLFFWAGLVALLAAAWALGPLVAALYRRYFRHLTSEEFSRQALFHRGMIARLFAIAGIFWLLSPLWTSS